MIRLSAVALLVMLGACGNARSGGDRHPHVTGPPVTSGSATPSEAHPSEQDCDAFIGHALDLELAARPAERRVDDAERARVQTQLRQTFGARCRELPAATYQCFMAATTLDALHRCDEPQATLSSSTSNSSVAFGGITPPAPRAP